MKKLTEEQLLKIKGGGIFSLYIERFTYMFRYIKVSYLVSKSFE